MNFVHGDAVVTDDVGLHARPSVKLTQAARVFAARIDVSSAPGGPWSDAKSIVQVMATRLKKDGRIYFRASGSDAGDAVTELVALVKRNFDLKPEPADAGP